MLSIVLGFPSRCLVQSPHWVVKHYLKFQQSWVVNEHIEMDKSYQEEMVA